MLFDGSHPLTNMQPGIFPVQPFVSFFDEIQVKIPISCRRIKITEIVVYCRSGRRSAIAADTLISLGYAKIYDLGAISSWTYGLEK